jgi:hypothetical protein
LILRAIYTLPITGQGFAWDPSQPGVLFGIDRPKRQVVVIRVPDRSGATAEVAPLSASGR